MTKGQFIACQGIVAEMVRVADGVKSATPPLKYELYLKFMERMRSLRVLLAVIGHCE